MKKKELKNLAIKIAKQENIIQDPNSTQEQRKQAEKEIFALSSKVGSLEDFDILDELIQSLL